MNTQTIQAPARRAAEYLKRIAQLTGAEQVQEECYRLRAGRKSFLVDYKCVRVISRRGEATCFSLTADPDIPSAEVLASALLQLKNNPSLFSKWRRLQGYSFKANGKMFKPQTWLAGDEV